MKTELEIANDRIKELEAIVENLKIDNYNTCDHSDQSFKDHEFSLHQHWGESFEEKWDRHSGTIRHFQS